MRFFFIFFTLSILSLPAFSQSIQNGGTGCPDHFCIWITGKDLGMKPVLSIFRDAEAKNLIARYATSELSPQFLENGSQSLSVKLATPEEMDALERGLVFVRILNTEKQMFSNIYSIKRNAPPSPSLSPSNTVHPLEIGGTNYVVYDLGQYLEKPDLWGDPVKGVKMVLARFDDNKTIIKQQIKDIADAGQKKISLMLWYTDASDLPDVYMHTINITNGLSMRHQKNFKDILIELKKYNFDTVTLRFAPQGNSDPAIWKKWEEDSYVKQWRVIQRTIDLFNTELSSHNHIQKIYDLGAEGGGLDAGERTAYNRRLWRDYAITYGLENTVGFSVAYYPSRLKKLVEDYDAVGLGRPSTYALDIYDSRSVDGDFYRVAKELKELGEERKKVILQETYYNNGNVAIAVKQARQDFGLNIISINQWPLEQFATTKHFSVLNPAPFEAYLKTHLKPNLSVRVDCSKERCLRLAGTDFSEQAQILVYDGNGSRRLLKTFKPSEYIYSKLGKDIYVELILDVNTWSEFASKGLTIQVLDQYDLLSKQFGISFEKTKLMRIHNL